MKLKKLVAPSLKELFVTELENMIISGKLEIGSKLPSERELAASMQVSRAVVNAGIAELEKKGFLVVKPRIGTFVEDFHRNGTIDTLVAVMKYNGGMLRDNEIRSILEVRTIFITLASSLAADNASDEEISALHRYLDDLKGCNDCEEAARLLYLFNHEIAFISRNTFLPLLYASFKDLVCTLWVRYAQSYGIEPLYLSALELYRHLADRDKEALGTYADITSKKSIEGDRPIYTG